MQTEVECPEGIWTKVSTAMQKGKIQLIDNLASYSVYASVPTDDPAPTTLDEGKMIRGIIIKEDDEIVDLYVWAVGNLCNIRSTKNQ